MILQESFAAGNELSCHAVSDCCSNFGRFSPKILRGEAPSGIGGWRYPNGSYVLFAEGSHVISRQDGHVDLHRQGGHSADGIWRCEVPGVNGTNDTVHIGIYSSGNGMYVESRQVYVIYDTNM